MSDKYVERIAFEDPNKAKEIIIRWILDKCNDQEGELIHLLDKAYPHGAEEELHEDWVVILVDHEERIDGSK